MSAEILLKSDRPTLAIEAHKDGRISVRSSAWDETRTILANQYLELRNRDGQVDVIRCDQGQNPAAALLADEAAINRMAEQLYEASSLTGNLDVAGMSAARYVVT